MPSEADHGRIIGRYALYDMIAAGGMATVHLGRLVGPVGFSRTVAIKRLLPQFAIDPQFVSMFIDEARVAARIRHPNVVATLDVVAEQRELFLVMEYVQGESLARLLKMASRARAPVPLPVASAIACGMLAGLHAAHEATNERGEALGIVHRDVSPQNVLVGVDGVPRVLDFGIAKAAGRLQTTREGVLKGKISYMAPEQLRHGSVDRRTDVYAASVVIWEMLAGRRLFKGDNEWAVANAISEGTKSPPSEHHADVTEALDAVVMRGLSRDPELRFASSAEMAEALESRCPPASARQVAAWLIGLASDVLDARAARVFSVEQLTPTTDAAFADFGTPELSDTRTEAYSTVQESKSGVSALRPQISDTSSDIKPVSGARRSIWIGVGVGMIGVAFGAGMWISRTTPYPGRETTSAAATVMPRADPPTPSIRESAAAPAPRDSIETTPSASASAKPAPAARGARPPRPRADNCDPPYTINAQGIRAFKPECL